MKITLLSLLNVYFLPVFILASLVLTAITLFHPGARGDASTSLYRNLMSFKQKYPLAGGIAWICFLIICSIFAFMIFDSIFS